MYVCMILKDYTCVIVQNKERGHDKCSGGKCTENKQVAKLDSVDAN